MGMMGIHCIMYEFFKEYAKILFYKRKSEHLETQLENNAFY